MSILGGNDVQALTAVIDGRLNFERCVGDAFRGGGMVGRALREMGGGHIHVEFAGCTRKVALNKIFIILLLCFYKCQINDAQKKSRVGGGKSKARTALMRVTCGSQLSRDTQPRILRIGF